MDERMLDTLRRRYRSLSDKELFAEYDFLRKDNSFFYRDEHFEVYYFYERERALSEEFSRRGIVIRW